MRSFLIFSIFLLGFFVDVYSQSFILHHARTNEHLEGVAAVLFYKSKPTEINRSNYKGEIYFTKFNDWDSCVFFRLGLNKLVIEKAIYTRDLYMNPIQNVIDEVVVTGLITPGNKYQSPFKIKYFTVEEIKNKNAISLADFLLSENNFSVTQDPILGTKVTQNGMGGSDLKLMIDGIPVAGRLNGNIDYSQVLLANVERIEVVDGPLSTIYGTNATGGVINLITKTGTNYESNLQGSVYAETVGVLNANAYYNSTQKGHRISLGVHRNYFGGWDQNADSLKQAVRPIWRDKAWNPKEQFMVNTSYYAPLSKKTNLHLKINGFWETIMNKLDPASSQQYVVYDEYYKTTKFNVGGNFNTMFSKTLELQNYCNFNYFARNTEYYSQDLVAGTDQFLRKVKEEIYNVFGRTQMKHEFLNKDLKLLYGADYNMDIGISEKLDTSAKAIRDFSMFFMVNAKLGDKILIQPGLRYSINNVTTTPVSSTINCRYEVSKHFSARLSYSRGYRIPEMKELYFTFVDINHNISGNPNLQKELNDNIQFGIDVLPPKDKAKDRLVSYSSSLNFTYFNKSDAIDIVNINPTKNEFMYLNVGNYKGLITNLDNRVKYKDYILVFGASLNGFQKKFHYTQNQIEDYLFNWTLNLNFTYYYKAWDVKFTTINKLNSENNFVVYNLQTNLVEQSQIPAYLYSDFNFSKKVWDNRLTVSMGIKNIFDIKNLRVQGYSGNVHNFSGNNEITNLWGRTLFTTLTLNIDDIK